MNYYYYHDCQPFDASSFFGSCYRCYAKKFVRLLPHSPIRLTLCNIHQPHSECISVDAKSHSHGAIHNNSNHGNSNHDTNVCVHIYVQTESSLYIKMLKRKSITANKLPETAIIKIKQTNQSTKCWKIQLSKRIFLFKKDVNGGVSKEQAEFNYFYL